MARRSGCAAFGDEIEVAKVEAAAEAREGGVWIADAFYALEVVGGGARGRIGMSD
jgi:hypothetical protein